MRRGIKELDLLLDRFAQTRLDLMQDEQLSLYDRLLHEHDLDIFQWLIGQKKAPVSYRNLIDDIIIINHPK